ncbi:peroxiredoxin [Candidatus Woesearchaeota archaeon]|nr:peroxiredoxin [Candidatus Woesearchaeota archaeon]
MLNINEKAPNFKLRDKDGEIHELNKINSEYFVIYFYPKDDTTGCTTEAKEFTTNLEKFEELNTKIIGISGGDENSKKKFIEKYDLKILLLSDTHFDVCKKYGVYGWKNFMGNKFLGINRTTYVLNKNKKVIKVYGKVKAEGHSKEVLEFIRDERN